MAAFAFLVFRVVHRFPWVRSARLTAAFVAIAVIFLVHQRLVVGRTSQTAPISGTYAQTLLDMLPVVPEYLRLLFGLPPFRIDYSFLPGGHALFSGPVLLGGVLLGGAVAGVAWAWRRRELGLAALGWTWAGLFLLPVSNLVPMMQYMAERFLYLPLVGCTLAGAALLGLIGQRRVVVALGAGAAILWAVVAWDRSWIWHDEITLFVESSRQSPRTPRVEENAAAAFFKLPAIEQAFGLVPGTRKLYAPRAGTVDWPAAIMALQRACTLFPKEESLANALATAHAQAGYNRDAVQGFATLAREHPTRALYWANLGRAHLEGKNLAEAEVALRRALALAPDDPLAWRTLAAVHWRKEDFEAARQCFERLQSLEPGNVEDRHWLQQATLRTKGEIPAPVTRQ
jgi:tetratricopeptide (TPR) repeat protein